MEPVKWGMISTAKIGIEKVIPAMQKSQHCKIAAIASRDLALAAEMGREARHPQGLWQL